MSEPEKLMGGWRGEESIQFMAVRRKPSLSKFTPRLVAGKYLHSKIMNDVGLSLGHKGPSAPTPRSPSRKMFCNSTFSL